MITAVHSCVFRELKMPKEPNKFE